MLSSNSMGGMPIKYFDDPAVRARTDRLFFLGMAPVIGAVSAFVNSPPRPAFDHFMLHVTVHVDAIDFAILAIAGILFRNRDSETHKRLIFLATVVVAARFPFMGRVFKTGWHHYID